MEEWAEQLYGLILSEIGNGGSKAQLRHIADALRAAVAEKEAEVARLRAACRAVVCAYDGAGDIYDAAAECRAALGEGEHGR